MADRVAALECAVRFLWKAWSDAEGSGQPERAAFGPDKEMREWLEKMDETDAIKQAPDDVQAVIREVLAPDWGLR
jgi:hypothetical protein